MISIDQRCHGKNRSLLQPKCLSPIQYWHWPNLIDQLGCVDVTGWLQVCSETCVLVNDEFYVFIENH